MFINLTCVGEIYSIIWLCFLITSCKFIYIFISNYFGILMQYMPIHCIILMEYSLRTTYIRYVILKLIMVNVSNWFASIYISCSCTYNYFLISLAIVESCCSNKGEIKSEGLVICLFKNDCRQIPLKRSGRTWWSINKNMLDNCLTEYHLETYQEDGGSDLIKPYH